jgi:starch synthase
MRRTARKPMAEKRPASSEVRKVWMFSYECAGLAQAGGLGEAVAGLSRTLASDYGLDVTVFLPSHGRYHDSRIKQTYGLEEESQFIASGQRIGTNGVHYGFLSGIEKGVRDRVKFVLVKGLDAATSRWLDDPVLYGGDVTLEKMALFSRTVRIYPEFLLSMRRQRELPDLIHANDWHMVPAGVAVKQTLAERGVMIPLLFTVHLLSHMALPWHYASEEWCGIRDRPKTDLKRRAGAPAPTHRQIWDRQCQGSLEKFGCFESDYVTSVSQSYLTHDVQSYVGSIIAGKSGYIYNGCDWDPDQIRSTVLGNPSRPMIAPEKSLPVNRWDLRSDLLTHKIAQVPDKSRPDDDAEDGSPISNAGGKRMTPFRTDGPLVLMTGRLSPQKGADLLLEAAPQVIKLVPNVKFLLFLLPSSDESQIRAATERASAHPDNTRIILAQDRQTYLTSHIAADVYAMPSRSEPFGISALEAMVTGNPVVGTYIGGISETVLDIREHGRSGTGLLVPSEDPDALADSLVSMLCVMQIDERAQRGEGGMSDLMDIIPVKVVRQLIGHDLRLGTKVRENCRSRVGQNFRWKNAGRTAIDRYNAARKFLAESSRLS